MDAPDSNLKNAQIVELVKTSNIERYNTVKNLKNISPVQSPPC